MSTSAPVPELPHAYPFRFIDRILQLSPGKEVSASKLVTFNESQIQGHFPGRPILPGALLIEACAQASGLVVGSPDQPAQVMFLSYVDDFKLLKPVLPGDSLVIHSRLDRRLGKLCHFECEVRSAGEVVAKGVIVLAIS